MEPNLEPLVTALDVQAVLECALKDLFLLVASHGKDRMAWVPSFHNEDPTVHMAFPRWPFAPGYCRGMLADSGVLRQVGITFRIRNALVRRLLDLLIRRPLLGIKQKW